MHGRVPVYAAPNVLFFLVVLSIHVSQLKFLPGHTTVRPIFPFFMVFLVLLLVSERGKGGRFLLYSQEVMKRWGGFLVFVGIYFLFIPAYNGSWSVGIKKIVSFFVAVASWWMGYSCLGMHPERFRRVMIASYTPFVVFGLAESASMFIPSMREWINAIRDAFLTFNIDRDRLHLQFSEPSFLATYLLMFFYVIRRDKKWRKHHKLLLLWGLLMIALSRSLTVFLVMGVALLFVILKERGMSSFSLALAGMSTVLFASSNAIAERLSHALALEDISTYVRYLNTLFSWSLGLRHYGFGAGFIDFGEAFANYLDGMDLRGSAELEAISRGELEPEPYGVFAQVFAYMGLPGLFLFLSALLRGVSIKEFFPYIAGVLVASMTALPWGLPYAWILMGMVARESRDMKAIPFGGKRRT